MDYYDLFNEHFKILDYDIVEDGHPVEEDRFSHTSGHYTVQVGYQNYAFGFAKCRTLVRIDEQCMGEMEDFNPDTQFFLFKVTEELAISPSGNGDVAEKLVNILRHKEYGSPIFENFYMLKVRALANNNYLVQFYVEFTSDDDAIKQEMNSEEAIEVEMAAYESKLEDRLP